MGVLKGSCCPHYDGEAERRPFYTRAVSKYEAIAGIALADFTAAHFIDRSLEHVLSWSRDRKVYVVSSEAHVELVTSLIE